MSTIAEKVMAGIIFALILVGSGEAFLLHHEKGVTQTLTDTLATTNATLQAEQATNASLNKSIKAVQDSLDAKVRALAALKAKNAKTEGELNAALTANAAWSNQPVPDAVFDSLFHSAGTNPDRGAEGTTTR